MEYNCSVGASALWTVPLRAGRGTLIAVPWDVILEGFVICNKYFTAFIHTPLTVGTRVVAPLLACASHAQACVQLYPRRRVPAPVSYIYWCVTTGVDVILTTAGPHPRASRVSGPLRWAVTVCLVWAGCGRVLMLCYVILTTAVLLYDIHD